jgi:hypothetical protein
MKVCVFGEFTGLQVLSQYCTVEVGNLIILDDAPANTRTDECKVIAKTNIKIFFNPKDEADRLTAYALKDVLCTNNIASFVTDQLYITTKDAHTGKTIQTPLPKDRIIMKML